MPSKTQKSKMPPGKMQFGIIVPTEVHRDAKHLAADMGWRISDVYAEGVKSLLDATRTHQGPEEVALVKTITKGLDKSIWQYFIAVADFFRGKPRPDQVEMLKLILGKHMPEEGRVALRANG